MSLQIARVAVDDVPWSELATATDRTVGQTRGWLRFLEVSLGARPAVGAVTDGTDVVGWFTGALVRRGGVLQLGSPLPGWTTSAMGFNLRADIDRIHALGSVPAFAFAELGCWHLELADRALTDAARVPPGFHVTVQSGYELTLADDERLLAAMTTNGRRNIKKAARNGIVIEEVPATDPGRFAEEFHAHLTEAFLHRGVRPTYPVERVHHLIEHVGPAGGLLLLRARTADGAVAGNSITAGLPGGTAEFWGGASHRPLHPLCPNEALMWAAMRRWRDRGAVRFNFGGGGDYKRKYGGLPHELPRLRRSRVAVLEPARALALRARRLRAARPWRG